MDETFLKVIYIMSSIPFDKFHLKEWNSIVSKVMMSELLLLHIDIYQSSESRFTFSSRLEDPNKTFKYNPIIIKKVLKLMNFQITD